MTRAIHVFVWFALVSPYLANGGSVPAQVAFPDSEGWQGTLHAVEAADVAFLEAGVVQSVGVEVGQIVRKGDVLGVLDNDLQLSNLRVAEHQAGATGILDAARGEYELKLHRRDALKALGPEATRSPLELATAEADLAVAKGRLLAANEEIELRKIELQKAQQQLSRRTLYAPFDGVITEVFYRVGESVTPYEPKLVRLIRTDRLVAELNVPAREIRRIRETRSLHVRTVTGPRPVIAQVQWIAPRLTEGTASVRVRAVFDNQRGEYLAGDKCFGNYAEILPGTAASPTAVRSEY